MRAKRTTIVPCGRWHGEERTVVTSGDLCVSDELNGYCDDNKTRRIWLRARFLTCSPRHRRWWLRQAAWKCLLPPKCSRSMTKKRAHVPPEAAAAKAMEDEESQGRQAGVSI